MDNCTDFNWGIKQDNDYSQQYEHKRKKRKYEHNSSGSSECNHETSIFKVGNEIYFSCGIDKYSIQMITKFITEIIYDHVKEHKNNKSGVSDTDIPKLEIVYIVDSPGGSVTSVLKFVDFIKIIRKKYKFLNITSIISGMVASAGTIMAMVADKRYMTSNAYAMIHELSAGNSCKFTQFKSYMSHLQKLHDNMVEIYCTQTGKSKEEIEELLKEETWFSAEQYHKNGFVDEIK